MKRNPMIRSVVLAMGLVTAAIALTSCEQKMEMDERGDEMGEHAEESEKEN
jgi:hypothetical protein